jgi:hypothetical protein
MVPPLCACSTTFCPPSAHSDSALWHLCPSISATTPEHSHTVHLTDPIEDPHLQALVEYLETQTNEFSEKAPPPSTRSG